MNFVRMFKPRFAALVEAGTKTQTVRPKPKRMPRPGDTISLRCWSGKPYRSKQRVIREAVITEVHPVFITPHGLSVNRQLLTLADTEAFARADGFSDWANMRTWFEVEHGLPFEGILIRWK